MTLSSRSDLKTLDGLFKSPTLKYKLQKQSAYDMKALKHQLALSAPVRWISQAICLWILELPSHLTCAGSLHPGVFKMLREPVGCV